MTEQIEPDVLVEATHPLWAAFDDDDWNGATASVWMSRTIKPGMRVRLEPPPSASQNLIERITNSMVWCGATVVA